MLMPCLSTFKTVVICMLLAALIRSTNARRADSCHDVAPIQQIRCVPWTTDKTDKVDPLFDWLSPSETVGEVVR